MPVPSRASGSLSPYLRDCADDLVEAEVRADVHDLRVACRRIRSVLRTGRSLWPAPDGRPAALAERCRSLGSHLSGARDDEVAAQLLRCWADDQGWAPEDLAGLLDELELSVPEDREPLTAPAVPGELLAEALELAGDVRELAAEQDDTGPSGDGADGLGARVDAERTRVLRRAERATSPTEWHEVRKAAKRLRYTAEAQARSAPDGDDEKAASATVAAAKRLQTVLGDLRDVQQVEERLVAHAAGPLADRALVTAVRNAHALSQEVPAAVEGLRRTV